VKFPQRFVLACCCLLIAGPCQAAERIEILLDASMGMWQTFQTGTPRIAAVRSAINTLVASPDVSARRMEIGLRTIGGRSDIVVDSGCADSDVLVPGGPVDPAVWSAVLADLDPRGGRGLVYAIEKTFESLAAEDAESRIVVVTSGNDQCQQDIVATLQDLARRQDTTRIRIVGLGIEHQLATSMLASAPTRNVTDPARLIDTLKWAILHPEVASTRAELLDLYFTRDEKPVVEGTLYVKDPSSDEEIVTSVDNGAARVRVAPSLLQARLEGADFEPIELSGIDHSGSTRALEIALVDLPPVTLEVDPERPLAGDNAYVQYWGAIPGINWLGVALAGAEVGGYIVRAPAPEASGEVTLQLPDSPNQLELQFTRELRPGLHQLLGRLAFETARRKLSIKAPAEVENGTVVEFGFTGDELPGDHIAIALEGSDIAEYLFCVPVSSESPITIAAPVAAGKYIVRYISRRGRTLARAGLDVFEILATLDGPSEIGPGEDFSVAWTGPDAEQDFLSIAAAGEEDHVYQSFLPTAEGNPALLFAPRSPGDYELRYVRASDGEVLARQQLSVIAVEISLEAPAVVEAGTRFEVEWTGTAEEGDFLAVASPGSGAKKHFDWTYANLGSPVTLAAPFEPGQYVLRYVSGATQKVVARRPLKVR
jgi:Ca-activated chloride channel family protein